MAHLKDISVYTCPTGEKELLMLWDNDRCQSVKFDSTDSISVIMSFERVLRLLAKERAEWNI